MGDWELGFGVRMKGMGSGEEGWIGELKWGRERLFLDWCLSSCQQCGDPNFGDNGPYVVDAGRHKQKGERKGGGAQFRKCSDKLIEYPSYSERHNIALPNCCQDIQSSQHCVHCWRKNCDDSTSHPYDVARSNP